MSVWVVRTGKNVNNEEWNFAHGLVTIGWPEVGDLTGAWPRREISVLVDGADPSYRSLSRPGIVGKLLAFRAEMRPGDLVVMPLEPSREDQKLKRRYYRFGRVAGDYAYDVAQSSQHRSHTRAVEWSPDPISKTAIGEDVLSLLNSPGTIFKPRKHDAATRLETLMETMVGPAAK